MFLAPEPISKLTAIFVMSSDAAKAGTANPGISGYMHGRSWRVALRLDGAIGPFQTFVNALEFVGVYGNATTFSDDTEGYTTQQLTDSLTSANITVEESAKALAMELVHSRLRASPAYMRMELTMLIAHIYGPANAISDAGSRGYYRRVEEHCTQLGITHEWVPPHQSVAELLGDLRALALGALAEVLEPTTPPAAAMPPAAADVTSNATTRPQFDPHGNGIRISESDVPAPSDGTGDALSPTSLLRMALGGRPLVDFAPAGSAADGLSLGGRPLVDFAPAGSAATRVPHLFARRVVAPTPAPTPAPAPAPSPAPAPASAPEPLFRPPSPRPPSPQPPSLPPSPPRPTGREYTSRTTGLPFYFNATTGEATYSKPAELCGDETPAPAPAPALEPAPAPSPAPAAAPPAVPAAVIALGRMSSASRTRRPRARAPTRPATARTQRKRARELHQEYSNLRHAGGSECTEEELIAQAMALSEADVAPAPAPAPAPTPAPAPASTSASAPAPTLPALLLCGCLVCAIDGRPSDRRPWPFIWDDQPPANARVLRERAARRAARNAIGKEYSSDATGDGPAASADGEPNTAAPRDQGAADAVDDLLSAAAPARAAQHAPSLLGALSLPRRVSHAYTPARASPSWHSPQCGDASLVDALAPIAPRAPPAPCALILAVGTSRTSPRRGAPAGRPISLPDVATASPPTQGTPTSLCVARHHASLPTRALRSASTPPSAPPRGGPCLLGALAPLLPHVVLSPPARPHGAIASAVWGQHIHPSSAPRSGPELPLGLESLLDVLRRDTSKYALCPGNPGHLEALAQSAERLKRLAVPRNTARKDVCDWRTWCTLAHFPNTAEWRDCTAAHSTPTARRGASSSCSAPSYCTKLRMVLWTAECLVTKVKRLKC